MAGFTHYRVVDLRDGTEQVVNTVQTPEQAALTVLGEDLVRSGSKNLLRAKVYYGQAGEPVNMVRLYGKVAQA